MASFFNANADPGASDSYPTLQLRQRIAEAMLKNASRRGYPKNIGEGLTAIGDAIGERGQMQALMGSQKAIEDLAARNAPDAIRAREGTPVSEAQPTSQTADAQPPSPPVMAQDDTPDLNIADAAPMLPAPSMDTAQSVMAAPPAAYFPAPTAQASALPPSLAPTAAGPMNPAQSSQMASLMGPPGGRPTPSPYFPTASLTNGPAVPQPPNPTLGAGNLQPATVPSLAAVQVGGAGSPREAADNRQIDFPMPNTQVAQARPSYTGPNLGPLQSSVPPNKYTNSVQMPSSTPLPYPKDAPKNGAEIEGERRKQLGIDLDDPMLKDQGDFLITKGKELRDKADADAKAQWEKRNQLQQELNLRQQTEGSPLGQQQLAKAKADAVAAETANRFGGPGAYQKFVDEMADARKAIQPLANTMPMYEQAKQALKSAYVGSGSELSLDMNKMLHGLGVPGDYSPAVATEMLRSRMAAIAAGFVKGTVGSTNISDRDVAFVEQAYSGKLNMEAESIRRLLNIAQEAAIKTVNQHNDRLIGVANDPVADQALRRSYRVPMQYGNDAEILKQQSQNPKIIEYFDKKYGNGHAKAVLTGKSYGD